MHSWLVFPYFIDHKRFIKGTGKWFELEDLHVKEILPQMITLTESYIQVNHV